MTVGIFTASEWEFLHIRPKVSILERGRSPVYRYAIGHFGNMQVLLVRTGIGPHNARRAAEAIFDIFPLNIAIITGFACALKPASVGDLIIGNQTFRLDDATPFSLPSHPILLDCAERTQQYIAIPSLHGTVVTADQVIWKAEKKRYIAASHHATGLDMESAELAKVAASRDTPCLIVRAVSDLLDEDLPLDFNLFRTPRGIAQGVTTLIQHPTTLVALYRLKMQGMLAASHLCLFLSNFLPNLNHSLLPSPSTKRSRRRQGIAE